jgi:Ribbon-helix-helix protein, copG family
MTETDDKVELTVRITVKLRPDEYDELSRHVRQIGSSMSAFLRESAARAIKESQPVSLDRALSPENATAPD